MDVTIRLLSIITTFSLGTIISGGIFSFIAMIGVVPRLAEKTRTTRYAKYYEMVIVLGGLWGASTLIIPYRITLPLPVIALLFLCGGMFIGAMAVSITEVLDVIPIVARRTHTAYAVRYFMFAIGIGKSVGTFFYFLLRLTS